MTHTFSSLAPTETSSMHGRSPTEPCTVGRQKKRGVQLYLVVWSRTQGPAVLQAAPSIGSSRTWRSRRNVHLE